MLVLCTLLFGHTMFGFAFADCGEPGKSVKSTLINGVRRRYSEYSRVEYKCAFMDSPFLFGHSQRICLNNKWMFSIPKCGFISLASKYVGFKNESVNFNELSINLYNNSFVVGLTLKVFSTSDLNIISMSNIKNAECQKTQLGFLYSFKCHTTIVAVQMKPINAIDVTFDQNITDCKTCRSRLVTYELFEYNDECETPDKPLFGSVRVVDRSKKVFEYFCNSGFVVDASKTTQCSMKQDWSNYEPSLCFPKVTCKINAIDSNVFAAYTDLWSNDEALVGSKVRYKCIQRGSMISGHWQQTCTTNGTWSGSTPKCVIMPHFQRAKSTARLLLASFFILLLFAIFVLILAIFIVLKRKQKVIISKQSLKAKLSPKPSINIENIHRNMKAQHKSDDHIYAEINSNYSFYDNYIQLCNQQNQIYPQ